MSILVVNEADDIRLLLEAAGESEVYTAATTQEAFKILALDEADAEETDVELILLDIIMPDMDGIEACRRIKADQRLRDIPIVMVTAKKDEQSLGRAIEAGAIDFITKPIQETELVARVSSVLRAKRATDQIRKLNQIGTALSSERNLDKLLELIVDYAREFTHADGGTLYMVNEEDQTLIFTISQNDTLGMRQGGTSGEPPKLPPVPLIVEDRPNLANVCARVANTGELLNIPDVYYAQIEGIDFTGTRKFDQFTGYRSKSMLTVPMRNHENEIIGVLQLLNALDSRNGEVIPFSSEYEELITSLASQAAVAITNTSLIHELENLFEAFIKTLADAIDEKSAYTGGHIRRVAELTMMIAHKIDETAEGPFADIHFTEEELNELRIAAWMHDIGKVTTPVFVVDKSTKLETIFDRIELLKARFAAAKNSYQAEAQSKKVELLTGNGSKPGDLATELQRIDEELQRQLTATEEDLDFVVRCNTGGEFMADEKIQHLEEIAKKTFIGDNGQEQPLLTEDELYNLSIRKGTLTDEERKIISNHALISIKMLSQLPFSRNLQRVPEYAGGHHECLNGSGYPLGLTAEYLPLQVRIMAVADIFEALTASDRPYQQPKMLSLALKILGFMVKDQHLDSEVVDLFVNEKVFLDYAARELDPSQLDEEFKKLLGENGKQRQ